MQRRHGIEHAQRIHRLYVALHTGEIAAEPPLLGVRQKARRVVPVAVREAENLLVERAPHIRDLVLNDAPALCVDSAVVCCRRVAVPVAQDLRVPE